MSLAILDSQCYLPQGKSQHTSHTLTSATGQDSIYLPGSGERWVDVLKRSTRTHTQSPT